MRHRAPRLALALVLAASVALVGALGGGAGARARGSTTIKLDDDFFKPKKKSVRKGTRVRFKWVGRGRHNVVKKRGPGGSFASETTRDRGVNFSKKFKKRGTYKLICTIHQGMKLKLKVR